MALSAAMRCSVGLGDDAEVLMCPCLYEMCWHDGVNPCVVPALSVGGGIDLLNILAGVADPCLPYVHLVCVRDVRKGEGVTRSVTPVGWWRSPEERDVWRAAYGYVPSSPPPRAVEVMSLVGRGRRWTMRCWGHSRGR